MRLTYYLMFIELQVKPYYSGLSIVCLHHETSLLFPPETSTQNIISSETILGENRRRLHHLVMCNPDTGFRFSFPN